APDHGDLDRAVELEDPPDGGGRVVAEIRVGGAGQNGGELPSQGRQGGVADGVDAPVQLAQVAAAPPAVDSPAAQAEIDQLRLGDEAALACRNLRHAMTIVARSDTVVVRCARGALLT